MPWLFSIAAEFELVAVAGAAEGLFQRGPANDVVGGAATDLLLEEPSDSDTVPLPLHDPSKPAKGLADWAWLAVADSIRIAPTVAALRVCPIRCALNEVMVMAFCVWGYRRGGVRSGATRERQIGEFRVSPYQGRSARRCSDKVPIPGRSFIAVPENDGPAKANEKATMKPMMRIVIVSVGRRCVPLRWTDG